VLNANEYVAWSNLTLGWVAFAGDTGTTQPLTGGTAQSISLPVSAASPGLYTISGTIGDGATTTTFVTHFTVWSATSGDVARPTAKTASAGAGGSLTTADQKETVSWPADVVPTTPGDGLIVEMAPQSPASTPAPSGTAWSAGGAPVDITVHTMLSNTPVHTFSNPLVITFPGATPTDVPIVSTDGGTSWSFVTPCDSPGVFPSGATDCYAVASGVLTVWTSHLTLFALASDRQPPTAPQNLGLSIYGG